MRVSAFMYLYRQLYEGVSETVARQDLHQIWQPNPTWQAFMQTVCQQLSVSDASQHQ
jgi:hypothetical protein